MVSRISAPANEMGTERATRNKIAKLARLHLQLSACEEQLSALDRQPAAVTIKEIDKKRLSSKIAAIKAEITELARFAAAPAAHATEDNHPQKGPRAWRSEQSPLDAVRLALVKEGHLGTLVNVRG